MTADELKAYAQALQPIDGVTHESEALQNMLRLINTLVTFVGEQDKRIAELEAKSHTHTLGSQYGLF